METIQGFVEHIVYRNEDNGYTVFSILRDGKELACVGAVPELSEGEYISAEGDFTVHSVYGRQFKADKISISTPEDAGAMERYLGSGAIKGIGATMAARIVTRFGNDTFRIMEEEPERLAEIKGISERKAREIYQQFYEKQDLRRVMMALSELHISQSMAIKIYKQYGIRAMEVIRENPYRLAEDVGGIGFKLADDIAKSAGIDSYAEFRIRCGILYMLQQGTLSGHTYIPEKDLLEKTGQLLSIEPEIISHQLGELQMARKIAVRVREDGEKLVYAKHYDLMELDTAAMLWRLDHSLDIDENEVEEVLELLEKKEKITLDPLQRDAVISAAQAGVLVITGGPGTGKTTTINTIIHYFEHEKKDILLTAPTGRAAKRMTEATGREAKTIHRTLEISGNPEDEGSAMHFERGSDHPLEADVIIVDEMSMVDIGLMQALLKAVTPGTKLILVGDVYQLPSVGPGRVLGDIIDSDCVKVVRLTKIFRQALESDIVRNAHLIHEGSDLTLDNKSRDFFCLKRYDASEILGLTVALVRDKLPGYVEASPLDIQVLTPMKKGELGVNHLNEILQRYLNPAADHKKEKEHKNGVLREGDKVMQIKNNYHLAWEIRGASGLAIDHGEGIFNGDIGIVREINHFASQLVVEFDECRFVTYEFAQLEELELAYAMTVHKSQGSEYPAVIMPLLSGPEVLFNRNILYTAVTRARRCVAIVGDEALVSRMIHNERQQRRWTSLDERLREMFHSPD